LIPHIFITSSGYGNFSVQLTGFSSFPFSISAPFAVPYHQERGKRVGFPPCRAAGAIPRKLLFHVRLDQGLKFVL
jgi:hypothetical protein